MCAFLCLRWRGRWLDAVPAAWEESLPEAAGLFGPSSEEVRRPLTDRVEAAISALGKFCAPEVKL